MKTADQVTPTRSLTFEQLAAEVQQLRAVVEVLLERTRPRLRRADALALGRLLPALVGAYGSEAFTCRDVVEDSSAAIRLVIGTRSAKSLGRLLARAADAGAVDGYVVERNGQAVNVTAWRIGGSVNRHF
jgi:hypothetical protein